MIDCFRLLAEMNAAGVDNQEVARRLGKTPSTVEYWKQGHIPRFDNAARLILLHADVVKPADIRVFVSSSAYKLVVTRTM